MRQYPMTMDIVLVDWLWPRGSKKEDAQIDEWLKDVDTSQTLRKWFGHQPEKWELCYWCYSTDFVRFRVLWTAKDLNE